MTSAFLNGRPATADDLRALALANYGHFTSMQVRDGAVQGRALHMRRLEDATFALFGARLDGADALQQAARALHGAGHGDASVRITVFSTRFDYRDPARGIVPDVLVTLSPAASADKPALRVKSYPFVRPLPQGEDQDQGEQDQHQAAQEQLRPAHAIFIRFFMPWT